MRIVPNLKEITECPRCGSNTLALYVHGDPSISDYKKCPACGEKLYESESTQSGLSEDKKKKKEQLIFDLREDVEYLTQNIHDAHTMTLVCNLREIFNKLIDYIEEN